MPKRGAPRGAVGLTLLEMVLAVTIFSVIVGALLGVWVMHARAVGHARNTLLATHLAESVLEAALAEGWQVQSIPPDPWTSFHVDCVLNGEKVGADFQYSLQVTRNTTARGSQLKLINVKVTWTEKDVEKEVNLDTVVTWQG